jgi:hypothetical protein
MAGKHLFFRIGFKSVRELGVETKLNGRLSWFGCHGIHKMIAYGSLRAQLNGTENGVRPSKSSY